MSRVRDHDAIYAAAMMMLAKQPEFGVAKCADLALAQYDALQDKLRDDAKVLPFPPVKYSDIEQTAPGAT